MIETQASSNGYVKRDLAGQVCKNVHGFDGETLKTSVCLKELVGEIGLKGKVEVGDGDGRGITEYLFFNCSLDDHFEIINFFGRKSYVEPDFTSHSTNPQILLFRSQKL